MDRAHQLDIAWFLALWQAIHGGDPPPDPIQVDRVTQDLLQVLTNHLTERHLSSSKDALTASLMEKRLNELGFQVIDKNKAGDAPVAFTITESERPLQPPPYCFHYQGQTICVYFPRKTVSAE